VSHGLRVLYIHGLEGSPQGHKAVALRKSFEVVAPAMDTSDFEACVAQLAKVARSEKLDALVGSSFGGAVAVRLLESGAWRGPTLLLAPAVEHFAKGATLPEGVQVVIVHGLRDAVVSIESSRHLASTGSPKLVRLVEVDDEHRLSSLLERDLLSSLVREVALDIDSK
jgi:predicted alpha/beta hydrolase family esterase